MISIKKTVLIVLLVILSSPIIIAQKEDSLKTSTSDLQRQKFYTQLGVGYNFSSGIGTFGNYVENSDYEISTKNFVGSFGKGFDISYGVGYKISRNFGIELDLGYNYGGKIIEENQYYDDYSFFTAVTIQQTITYRANTFRLNPKFLFEVPFKKGNAFYGKIGYLVGFGNSTTEFDENWEFNNGIESSGNYKWKQTGGFVSGSTTAIGFRFLAQEDISLFMELTGNNLHRTFERSILTEAIENNINVTSSIPTYYKEIIYVDNLVTDDSTPDITEPRKALAYRSNFSTVGFRIGFISHF